MTEAEMREAIMDMAEFYADKFHAPRDFEPGYSPVPVSGKVIGGPEMRSLIDSALDFWLTGGRFNTKFEQRMRAVLGRKVVLTCNSGSSANLLAMTALTSPELVDRALQPGDEVITCATGFPTTVNPSFNNNLVPVFLDVDIPTYNINTEALEEALSPRTRAIMVAHTLGNPFDLKTIMDFAKKHDLYVVEDTCDALGAEYDGKKVGTFGDIGTLSFYPAHHITMGEGGAVYCDSPKLKRALECLRDWGRDCWCDSGKDNTCQKRFEWQLGELPYGFDHKYTYSHLGYNLKITDLQAAVGLAQIPRIGEFVEARRQNYAFLRKQFEALEAYFILPEATPNSNPSWFGFPLTVRKDAGFTRDDLVKHLNDKKIGTRLLFGGNLLRQPYMLGRTYRTAGEIVNADIVMNDTFWIGVFPGLNEESLGYMFEVIDGFIKNGA
ncbi:MAG: lipopolysaccharide biosynthesis protein RfbH [Paracoccaceae bacterium]